VIDGEQGIRWLYGKTGAETMPTLKNAIAILANDANDDDYWDGTRVTQNAHCADFLPWRRCDRWNMDGD
jgi:hypothetical protein